MRVDEIRDARMDSGHHFLDALCRSAAAEDRRGRERAFHHVDAHDEDEEQDQRGGAGEKRPEDLARKGFAKSVADQRQRRGAAICLHWPPPSDLAALRTRCQAWAAVACAPSTVFTKTSSRVLVVRDRFSISQCRGAQQVDRGVGLFAGRKRQMQAAVASGHGAGTRPQFRLESARGHFRLPLCSRCPPSVRAPSLAPQPCRD